MAILDSCGLILECSFSAGRSRPQTILAKIVSHHPLALEVTGERLVSRVQPLLIKCGGGGEASGDSGHTFVALPEFG